MLQQDTEQLDRALQDNALLLTPNFRSSDQLIDAICRHRIANGARQVLKRPAITAIDTWLGELWTNTAFIKPSPQSGYRLLDSAGEKLLWQQIIRENSEGLLLLQQDSAADSLAAAWQLLQQWQVDIETPARMVQPIGNPADRDDLQWAACWLRCFDQYCKQHQLLTFGSMVQLLIAELRSGGGIRKLLPSSLLLWHFDNPPPLYRDLFMSLEANGCAVKHVRQTRASPEQRCLSFSNTDAEIQQAALWAKQVLDEEPSAVIGIICPEANLLKGSLHRIMYRVFAGQEGRFSSSLTPRLSDNHWFATAQLVLELADPVVPLSTICTMLRSPWICGSDPECDQRAALERRIRDLDEMKISLTDLQYYCRQDQELWHCPMLDELLTANRNRWQRTAGRMPMSSWYALVQAHWESWLPRELMLADRLHNLPAGFDEFMTSLQRISPGCEESGLKSYQAVVRSLLNATNTRENQRQTPVTLLTPTAATGMQFTHLWCMGLIEDNWPALKRPHPWLPVALQRNSGMPGCNHGATLEEAVALLRQFSDSVSRQLVWSLAEFADDLPLTPSPLLPASLTIQRIPAGPGAGLPDSFVLQEKPAFETLADTRVLPPGQLAGSSRLVRLQAECPFRAYAEERLAIKPLNTPAFGLSPAAIGTLVHEVLYRFWHQMQSSARLAACGEAQLDRHIDDAVSHGLNRLARRYPHTLTPGLRELETRRLAALLRQWMQAELQRGEFTVELLEESLQWSFEQLTLRLRLDRVDRTPTGLAVIDYKTGQTGSNTWSSTSPQQFQLLLYLFSLQQFRNEPVIMLMFGALHPKELGYTGIAADDSSLPSLAFDNRKLKVPEEDWQAVIDRWQRELSVLARELLDGHVAALPRQSAACQYCDLGPLCRIRELESSS